MRTQRCHWAISIIALWLIAVAIQPLSFADEGRLVLDKIHSPALAGNLLGDSATRNLTIYLPPGYDENPDQRYPVVYLLHGYGGTNFLWSGGSHHNLNVKDIADPLIEQGAIQPMIFVAPDASNRFGGSFYTNSATTGNWEDFITQEVVAYIDSTYRTLPGAESRGIAGRSMGGYGAIKLEMKHPEVYSALYAMSAGTLGFAGDFTIQHNSWHTTLALKDINQFSGAGFWPQGYIAVSSAFSPDPNRPPFFADFPVKRVDGVLKPAEPAYSKWLAHLPLNMLDQYKSNLSRFRGIAFDVGTSDHFTHIPPTNRALHEALTSAGIEHTFEEYPGGHSNRFRERMETKVLPFFSDLLAFEMQPTAASVNPRGKLATTWGAVKRIQTQ